MRQIKFTTALLLVAALSFVSFGFKGCSQSEKDQNVAFARDIAGAFSAGCPVVSKIKPSLGARCTQGAAISARLIDAFAASNQTEIAALVGELLPAFSDVVDGFSNNENVLGYFALGQIGLNFFVNHFLSAQTPRSMRRAGSAASSDAIDEVQRFKALPQFGCRLKPERCK